MATPAADCCNIGVGAGKSNYQLDYSTATGAGITTATPATMAASTGISNIMYASADSSMQMLRSDVDVDVIATNGYPRSEYRERAQDGTTLRAFTPTTGDHWVECWIFPTHLPPTFKPSFVMIQMHDNNDDIIEIAWQPAGSFSTDGKQEIVLRVNGHSYVDLGGGNLYNFPKLVADAKLNRWYRCKIRVGAIISGSQGYICEVNTATIRSDDTNMPAMATSGANSYFKCGMYLQTKWTGSGTGGLETDRNEYGEAGYRDFRTSHNGETATSVQVRGTNRPDTISSVTWGTKVTGRQSGGGTGLTSLSPALPGSLTVGDTMFCIVRSSRGINNQTVVGTSSAPSPPTSPSSPSISGASGWVRVISTHTDTSAGGPSGPYPSGPQLAFHNCRWQLWAKPWVSGDAAPSVTYSSTTNTDTMTAQTFKCSGAKYSTAIWELIDQEPNGLDLSNPSDNTLTITGITYAAATSTTVLGPTAALAANCVPGALAIACVYHETNTTNTTIGTVTGGSDGLTWAAGGISNTTTVSPAAGSAGSAEDEPAFAHNWAIVPSTAGQAIPAKQAAATLAADANKPNASSTVAGVGWGLLFTIAPARKHRRWLRAAA